MSKGDKSVALRLYKEEIDKIKRELSTLPAGNLRKRGACFYVKEGSSEKRITNNLEMLRQLSRKAYLTRRLKNLGVNHGLVKNHSINLVTVEPMEIIDSLPAAFKSFPIDYFFHPSMLRTAEGTTSSDWYSEGLIYLTNSGVLVRSKSERIIADSLDRLGVSYLYESALKLGNEVRNPDFTIHDRFNGRVVLWEHFGIMDDEDYRRNAAKKVALYVQHGFFPSSNLICTYEEDLLDPSRIEEIIRMYILK